MSQTTRQTSAAAGTAALMTALLAACVAFQLNASMLSPALVTMGHELGADDAAVGLSQTAFFTSGALFSLFLPRLSDIVGRRRVLVGMLVVMLAGTVLAAVSSSIVVVDVARVVQGVSGPTVPLCLLMLRSQVTDPKRYGTMMGLVTAVNGGIAGIDALVGGWLAANFGYRSVFWVIAIIAAVAVLAVLRWGPESRPSAGTRMDWRGVVPLVVAVAALLLALSEAGKLADADWTYVVGLFAVAVVAFAVFWFAEKASTHPLVRPEDLRRRSTWALLATTLLTMTGVFATVNGVVLSFAQNSQIGFGMSADLASVVFLTPFALIGWLVGPFAGRLAPTLGYRRVLRFGLVGTAVVMAVIALVGVHSLPVLIACTALLGITYAGGANIILNGLGVVLSPKGNPGFLPGMNAGAFNLGSGLSFAVLPAVEVAGGSGAESSAGYVSAILAGVVIVAAAFAVSFLIPRPAEAETA